MHFNRRFKQKDQIEDICKHYDNINPELRNFIYYIYEDLSIEELRNIDTSLLAKGAAFGHKEIQKRESKSIKIDLIELGGEYSLLQIIAEDLPFLIDSIIEELKSNKITIHLLVHPILKIQRNESGEILNVDLENSSHESLMQFYIPNISSVTEGIFKATDGIAERIETIIGHLSMAIEDFEAMKSRMKFSISNKDQCIPIALKESAEEVNRFLNWLIEKNFIFLGSVEYLIDNNDVNGKEIKALDSSYLGITKGELYHSSTASFNPQINNDELIFVNKWPQKSVIHRSEYMDVICVKKYNAHGQYCGLIIFLGLFANASYYEKVQAIPYVRKKIDEIVKRYGYPESSYNSKELVSAAQSLPRSELLQMTTDELYTIAVGIVSLTLIPRVKIFLRQSSIGHFAACFLFIPKNRFSTEIREVLEKVICAEFHANVSERYIEVGSSQVVKLQLIIKTEFENIAHQINTLEVENKIRDAIKTWDDRLETALSEQFDKNNARRLYAKYCGKFNPSYTSSIKPEDALSDILHIEDALEQDKVQFILQGTESKCLLRIFSLKEEISISAILPVIEHFGFTVLDMQVFSTSLDSTVYIYYIRLDSRFDLDADVIFNIQIALDKIWSGSLDDDRFNSLILAAKASWYQANIMRAYAKYLKQLNFTHTINFIVSSLTNHNGITKDLIGLFQLKFASIEKVPLEKIEILAKKISNQISNIQSISEDRVMKNYLNLMLATKRTNCFKSDDGDYIAFKISSKEVHDMVLPKPFMEIFVYSKQFEAIHLRGGRIARGGIRWSDRKEDFRTEVLGLMKAQMTKNSVIVPVGSKGGFVLKNNEVLGRNELNDFAKQCYQKFLRALLELTDNLVNNKEVKPEKIICYDDIDPYLVVAADKGTATFSDYANQVSKEYNFWLGDAFASGGSNGYDHKKLAITARGALVSVKHHFASLGIDIENDTFTATGIGDMSGDVFGNGLLLFDTVKLVAAFNHMHIFIDPLPDHKISYQERKRLFELPGSKWSDYNTSLISKGGGVFARTEKSIKLSEEVRAALDIVESELSPDDLIKAILRAPVDLIWNGGIGTYVKSSIESNEIVGDKSNDNLRVNGSEVRAKVIGEGGNLGFTQLGRIECARAGCKINTDFIDNSGGVNCSDYEVNIKIALKLAIDSELLTYEKRNLLLSEIKEDVTYLVLKNNAAQNLIISLEEGKGSKRLASHIKLMKYLSEKGELDKKVEFLPSSSQLEKMQEEGASLSRPEISVLIAYAKNSVISILLETDFGSDKYFNKVLYSYFPKKMSALFGDLLQKHKLRKEIIVMLSANSFINMMGPSLFHYFISNGRHNASDLMKAFFIILESLNLVSLWDSIEKIKDNSLKLFLLYSVQKIIEQNLNWVLSKYAAFTDIEVIYTLYKENMYELRGMILEGDRTLALIYQEYGEFLKIGEQEQCLDLVKDILAFRILVPGFAISHLATEYDLSLVARTYFWLSEKLDLSWLMLYVGKCSEDSEQIVNIAIESALSEIQDIQIKFTKHQLKYFKDAKEVNQLTDFHSITTGHRFEQYKLFMHNLKKQKLENIPAILLVIIKYLREIVSLIEE